MGAISCVNFIRGARHGVRQSLRCHRARMGFVCQHCLIMSLLLRCPQEPHYRRYMQLAEAGVVEVGRCLTSDQWGAVAACDVSLHSSATTTIMIEFVKDANVDLRNVL